MVKCLTPFPTYVRSGASAFADQTTLRAAEFAPTDVPGLFPRLSLAIDVPPVPDVKQEETSGREVILIKDPISADAQTAFLASRQTVMREPSQAGAHLIQLVTDGVLNLPGEGVKGTAEGVRPDWQCRGHKSSGLAAAIVTSGDLRARLFEVGLHLVRQFQAVFAKVVKPGLQLLEFRTTQLWDRRLDFLHAAHGGQYTPAADFGKREMGPNRASRSPVPGSPAPFPPRLNSTAA